MSENKSISIRLPDDWHVHLRDDAMLRAVTAHTANHFGRAIVMPNLVPPVVTCTQALAYRERILSALPENNGFKPLMTLYLTEDTSIEEIEQAADDDNIKAVKLYPAGATTNSQSGVRNIEKVIPVLEKMAERGLILCVHGEVTDHDVDIFDREAVFISKVLDPIRKRIPDLKVVLEHITTQTGVEYVRAAEKNLAATITTHHLIINRNHILAGGIKPHYYCLPVAKREHHRQALRAAATMGDEKFFLGTDSAPHTEANKLMACGCAGIFSSINTLSCLAHVFEEEDALENLEGFTSLNGPKYYGLPVNEKTIKLVKSSEIVRYPEKIETEEGNVIVFDPGFDLHWKPVLS